MAMLKIRLFDAPVVFEYEHADSGSSGTATPESAKEKGKRFRNRISSLSISSDG